jgi:hypothetical protein
MPTTSLHGLTVYTWALFDRDDRRYLGAYQSADPSWAVGDVIVNALGFFRIEAVGPVDLEQAVDHDAAFLVSPL